MTDLPWCECKLHHNKLSYVPETPGKRGPMIGTLETNDGWWIHSGCGKPSKAALNECDTCGRKFKGIKPGIKFAYTGPCCD